MSKLEIVLIGNDNLIELKGLWDEAGQAYLNTAAVTVTLRHKSGAEVAGQAWPLTLDYVAASNGNYRTVLVDDLVLSPRQALIAEVIATAGTNLKGKWKIPCRAEDRVS